MLKKILIIGSFVLDIALFIWIVNKMTIAGFGKFFGLFLLGSIFAGLLLRWSGQMTLKKVKERYKKNPKINGWSILGILFIMLKGVLLSIVAPTYLPIIAVISGGLLSLYYVYFANGMLYNIYMLYESIDLLFKKNDNDNTNKD